MCMRTIGIRVSEKTAWASTGLQRRSRCTASRSCIFKGTCPQLATEEGKGKEERKEERGGGSANEKMIAWSSSSGVPSACMLSMLSLLQGGMQH